MPQLSRLRSSWKRSLLRVCSTRAAGWVRCQCRCAHDFSAATFTAASVFVLSATRSEQSRACPHSAECPVSTVQCPVDSSVSSLSEPSRTQTVRCSPLRPAVLDYFHGSRRFDSTSSRHHPPVLVASPAVHSFFIRLRSRFLLDSLVPSSLCRTLQSAVRPTLLPASTSTPSPVLPLPLRPGAPLLRPLIRSPPM